MRNTLILVLLFCCNIIVAKNSVTFKFNTPPDEYIYPNTEYKYQIVESGMDGYFTYNVKTTWKISNGTLHYNGETSNDTIVTNELEPVTVKWKDVTAKGTISIVRVTWANTLSSDSYDVKFVDEKSYSAPILSLKGVKPCCLYCSSNDTPFKIGDNKEENISLSDETEYPHIVIYHGVQGGYENRTAEFYEWTIPDGWTSPNNNVFVTNKRDIRVTPHAFKGGTIKVRAVNYNSTSYSDYCEKTYSRSFSYTAYPQKITFGDTSPYTFSVPSITNVQYEWKAPAGWSINGGGNTLTTSSSEVQIRALNYTAEKVQVRLRLNQDVSDWYTCPGGVIAVPEITASVEGTIYQYEPLNFTINGLSGNNATINWRSDGYVISGQNSIQAKVAPTTVGAMNVYADISIPGYGSYTPGKQVSIANHRISLNKTVNSFGEGSCSLVNRPEGTNVHWEFLDDGYKILSSDNAKTTVVPLLYNATSTLKATVYSNWMSLPLTIDFTSAPLELTGTDFVIYKPRRCEINYLPYNASLEWDFSKVYSIKKEDKYVYVAVPKDLCCLPEVALVKAKVTSWTGTVVEKELRMSSIELTDFNLTLVQNNSREFLYKASYIPANIPYKELLFYWNCSDSNVSIATTACKGEVPEEVMSAYKSYSRKHKEPGFIDFEGGYPDDNKGSINVFSLTNDDSGLPFHYETNYAIFSFPGINPASAAIWCTVLDQAGNIITKRAAISTSRNASPYQVASNPVNNTLTLKKNDVEEIQAFENTTSGVVTVQLYNDYNIVKTLQVYEGEDVLQMNTSDLPNGTYYLNISKDGTVITRQLVLIKH